MTDRKGELVGGKPARTEMNIDVAGELLRESYGRPATTGGRHTLLRITNGRSVVLARSCRWMGDSRLMCSNRMLLDGKRSQSCRKRT
jgi:hypothetical protein